MGKILWSADWHLTPNTLDEYRWSMFPWTRKQIELRKMDALVIAGDLTNSKDNHPARLVNRLVDELKLTASMVPVHILMGNHDYIDPNNPFFKFLSELDEVFFYVHPRQVEVAGQSVLFLPHTKEYKIWKKLPFNQDFICFHAPVRTALNGIGRITEGVPYQMFNKDRTRARVISGDIHHPQRVFNVRICGAPHPINFGDDYEPRVLLSDDRKVTSLRRLTMKKVNITLESYTELAEMTELSEGDQVWLYLTLPRSEFVHWEKHKGRVLKQADKMKLQVCGIELKPLVATRNRIDFDPEVPSTIQTSNPTDTFKQFCQSRAEPLDDRLIKTGRILVKEVYHARV